jgi:hypothetical protein
MIWKSQKKQFVFKLEELTLNSKLFLKKNIQKLEKSKFRNIFFYNKIRASNKIQDDKANQALKNQKQLFRNFSKLLI